MESGRMAQRAVVPPMGRVVLRRTEQLLIPGGAPPVAVFQVDAIMSMPQFMAPRLQELATMACMSGPPQLMVNTWGGKLGSV